MAAEDFAFSSDYDGIDGVYTGTSTATLSGTIASGASKIVYTNLFNYSNAKELPEVYVRQSASGYNNVEHPVPPNEWIYVPATGSGVPAAGIDCHFTLKTSAFNTVITIRIFNGTGSTLTLTDNTLTFRYILTDLPWQTVASGYDYPNTRVTSTGDTRVTSTGQSRGVS